MVRAPCCEKMGLKKGPWTREEDHVLIDYITLYGHGNWRALPKQAGLLRCGKSCRLRWTNYLRPDIKRGNFSREEEDTIINLHGLLGNRWSAIAARLPGRTDNEIKNVWHTHLKKRLKHLHLDLEAPKSKKIQIKMPKSEKDISVEEEDNNEDDEKESKGNYIQENNSPQHSSGTDISSSVVTTSDSDNNTCMEGGQMLDNFPELDDDFWSEVFSGGGDTSNFQVENGSSSLIQCQNNVPVESGYGCSNISNVHDGMDYFWYDIFNRAGELPELLL